jgi:hypothetical protein
MPMMRVAVVTAVLALLPMVGLAQDQPAAAPQVLMVELASGKAFSGQIDAESGATRLVLRSSRGGAVLTRSIPWPQIVRASLDGQSIDLEKLPAVVAASKSPAPHTVTAVTPPTPTASVEQPAPPSPVAVVSVTFDARLANWNGSVETDGLLVDLFPVDADGYLAPASGFLEVELFAQERRDFQLAPQSAGRSVQRMERWTRQINATQFGASGLRLKLPFGAVHPEFDQDWLSMGLVHVKFTAPGHGVFEDSRDAIRIRPFAPNRDYLDMHTGRRFLPMEGLGRRN